MAAALQPANVPAVQVGDFDFELPAAAIAQAPAEPRDAARLLVFERGTGRSEHAVFAALPRLLRPGDLLVLNDTRVRPWRLCGQRDTGGRVECLILRIDGAAGEGFVKPSKKLAAGDVLA